MKFNKRFSHPEWSGHANVYEVNVRQYTSEGTINAFADSLTRLHDMGVKILWFMPLYPVGKEGRKGPLGSYYAIRDYCSINPEFGTLEDFKYVVKSAHELGMKVIIDIVANHTANDHHWVDEHPDYYNYHSDGCIVHPHGWDDTSGLNYDNKDLWHSMLDVMKYWLKECDIDGYRCDMAHLVPLEFWIWVRGKMMDEKEGLFWLAECQEPLYHLAFDATYTWRWMHASDEFMQGRMNLVHLAMVLYRSVTEFPCNALRLYFTTNHDENSWNGTAYEKYGDAALLFAVFTCTWNSIPLIYSGQELPNMKRLKFFERDPIEWTDDIALHDFYKTLLTLKSTNPALCSADPDVFTHILSHPDDECVFAFSRKKGIHEVLVILNCSNHDHDFEITGSTGVFRNVFGGDDIHVEGSNNVHLFPWGYLVFERLNHIG